MSLVLPLERVDPGDLHRFGGKATALARLRGHGFPVPRTVVIPVEGFRDFLLHHGLLARARTLGGEDLEEKAGRLREQILAADLTPELAGDLRREVARLSAFSLAVRSSAVDEDSSDQSFAGQYVSALDVAPGDAVEEAVKRCWASWFGDGPLAYRRRGFRRPPAAGMAVIVQELVDARTAGVLFTINPLTGSWREMVIEAAHGQGEAVVSGRVAPDRYLLRRPRRTPRPVQRVLARVRVEELKAEVSEQTRSLRPTGSGLAWIGEEGASGRKLTVAEVLRLGRLGLRSESLCGGPQDMEWAISGRGEIFVLQSRAVTVRGGNDRPRETLWTRRFAGERWTEPVSPMGWSIVAPLLEWFIAYPQTASRYLGGGAPLRLYRGWPYFNVSIFRHLAFKAPGLSPPRFLLEFFPPDEEKRWLLRHAAPPDFRVYASVLSETLRERRWRRFRWNPFTNHRAWDALRDQLDREIATLEDPQGVARKQVERCLEWMREYVKVHIISLLYANILYQWGHASLPVDLREDLLRSPEGSVTHRVNRALFDLGQGAPLAPFLAQYGHRGFTGSWDVFAPRWAEEPDRLARLVENYGGEGRSDPAALVEAQSQAADAAMQALRQQAKGISGSLSIVHVRLLRRYLDLREEQRFHFDRLLFALKKALLRMGTDLLKDSAERVRWLQWPELRDLSEGRLSVDEALEIIGRREARWKSYGVEPPPDFLVGDEGVDEPSSGRWLQGLGISSGRVTGPARVIHTPEEASRLQPGDILVARATDPGWTSLFLVAGGVVLELGSLLSHGAVVAREYRLPAVANLSGATRLLRDGQWLTIDGDTGRVWVHEEP